MPFVRGGAQGEVRVVMNALHETGRVTRQEAVSMLPVLALDPAPGDIVLDLCASPGSKTTQICEHLGTSGAVIANEVISGRVNTLVSNVQRHASRSAVVVQHDGRHIPMVPGFEQSAIRLTPDGGLEVRVGVQSHGQSLETTLAQVAAEILTINTDDIKVVHGDTAYTPYSTGTWGSRCAVMAGGAVSSACKELAKRVLQIGAHLLQADLREVELLRGEVRSSSGSVAIKDIARTWHHAPQDLPAELAARALELTEGYRPEPDSGTFSYAAHGCVVAVDPDIGDVEILDYVIVEDGGVLINPMVVDGQVYGGTAQGIGTALFEEMPYDEYGQPMANTLAEYLLPSACEMPNVRISHMETPSPFSAFGQKGLGEGGAIGPPAAIVNAINDAFKEIDLAVDRLPVSPARLFKLINNAKLTS